MTIICGIDGKISATDEDGLDELDRIERDLCQQLVEMRERHCLESEPLIAQLVKISKARPHRFLITREQLKERT